LEKTEIRKGTEGSSSPPPLNSTLTASDPLAPTFVSS